MVLTREKISWHAPDNKAWVKPKLVYGDVFAKIKKELFLTQEYPKIDCCYLDCQCGIATVDNNYGDYLYEYITNLDAFAIHVGHTGEHEFQSLLKNFLESKQLKIGEDLTENSIERRKERLGKPADHNLNYLRDKELANEWRDFHGKNANLKPQSAKENLTQKKQKVDMKPVIAPHLWK